MLLGNNFDSVKMHVEIKFLKAYSDSYKGKISFLFVFLKFQWKFSFGFRRFPEY